MKNYKYIKKEIRNLKLKLALETVKLEKFILRMTNFTNAKHVL